MSLLDKTEEIVITFNYDAVPTVRAFTKDDKFISSIMGPFGSGKSSGCVIKIFNYACKQQPNAQGIRKTRFAIIRGTYQQLKDTTKKTIEEWMPFAFWKESNHTFTISIKLGDGTFVESEWMLRALDRPDQVDNLLSLELTGAWINEAREIPKEVFESVQGRVGRYPRKSEVPLNWFGVILDTNPPDTDHWWFNYFEILKPMKCPKCKLIDGSPIIFTTTKPCHICGAKEGEQVASIYKQPSGISNEAENLVNLQKGYYSNLMAGKDEDFIRVHVYGEYGYLRDGRPVFTNFKGNIHIYKEDLKPIKSIPLIIGLDFGLTPAAVFTQMDRRGRLYIIDEIFFDKMSMDLREFSTMHLKPLIMSKYAGYDYAVVGDPAGTQKSQLDSRTAFQEIRMSGIQNIKPAFTNRIHPRLAAVNSFLMRIVEGKPAFIMSPHCTFIKKAMMGHYKFRRMRVSDEKYTDLPDKNWASHIADALQYACLGHETLLNTRNSMHRNISPSLPEPDVGAWT